MPADPILVAGDVIEWTVQGESTVQGQEVINRAFYRVLSTPATPVTRLSNANGAIYGQWNGTIMNELCDTYETRSATAKLVSGIVNSPGFPLTYSDTAVNLASFTGAEAQPAAPCFLAASCFLRTGFSGRNWRGGKRFGPLPNSALDVGAGLYEKLLPTYFTNLNTDIGLWRADITAPTGSSVLRLVILSKGFWADVGGFAGPAVDNVADVIGHTLSVYVRHQDSRQAPHSP